MNARFLPLSLWCHLALLPGLISTNAPAQQAKRHEHPGVNSLDVCVDQDRIHLLLGQKNAANDWEISHQFSDDWGATWSSSVMVNAGAPAPHALHRGTDARLAVSGRNLLAVWTAQGTDKWGSGPMATALSRDGGKTWKPGPNPADDGRTDGHGFIAAGTTAAGGFHLAWLDNRGDQRGLRYAESQDGGWTWSANATAVARTCECCWNAITPLEGGGAAVLYRAVSPRDMHVVLTRDRGAHWSTPLVAGAFGWQFEACPHVGGALTSSRPGGKSHLHAMVWTGHAEKAGVYHLRSTDGAQTWSEPRRMGVAHASHPHLAAAASGALAAVWDAPEQGASSVWTCVSRDDGQTWSIPVRLSPPGQSAEYPRVVPAKNGFRIFWTGGEPGRVTQWNSVNIIPEEDRFAPSFSTLFPENKAVK